MILRGAVRRVQCRRIPRGGHVASSASTGTSCRTGMGARGVCQRQDVVCTRVSSGLGRNASTGTRSASIESTGTHALSRPPCDFLRGCPLVVSSGASLGTRSPEVVRACVSTGVPCNARTGACSATNTGAHATVRERPCDFLGPCPEGVEGPEEGSWHLLSRSGAPAVCQRCTARGCGCTGRAVARLHPLHCCRALRAGHRQGWRWRC